MIRDQVRILYISYFYSGKTTEKYKNKGTATFIWLFRVYAHDRWNHLKFAIIMSHANALFKVTLKIREL